MGNVGEFCAPVSTVDDNVLEGYSCSAGHTLAYISPFGDVFPCVQFPMPCGSLRKQSFREIWWRPAALHRTAVGARKRPAHLLALLAMSPIARAARAWPIWKAIFAGRPRRIARSPTRAPGFPLPLIATGNRFSLNRSPCPDRRSQSSRVVIDFSLCRGIVRRSGRGKRVDETGNAAPLDLVVGASSHNRSTTRSGRLFSTWPKRRTSSLGSGSPPSSGNKLHGEAEDAVG